MPIYEYKCTTCDFSFEEKQGFDADPICVCPQCQNEARRLFKPAPIIFKGKGFYVTDYPNNGSGRPSQSSSEENTETEVKKKNESKSESDSTATAAKSADEK